MHLDLSHHNIGITQSKPRNRAERRKIRRGQWVLKSLSVVSVSVALSASTAVAAGACGGYAYAGKGSTESVWEGVEGKIGGFDTESIPSGYDHIANWLGVTDSGGSCGRTFCWIQTGNIFGSAGSTRDNTWCTSHNIQHAYMEENDVNAYDCKTYPAAQIPLTNSNYYTAYYTGSCPGGVGLHDAYIYGQSEGWVRLGIAYLPGCGGDNITVVTEFYAATGSCPALTKYEEFGHTTGPIEHSSNGATWSDWTTSGSFLNSPLNITPNPPDSTDLFKTWG